MAGSPSGYSMNTASSLFTSSCSSQDAKESNSKFLFSIVSHLKNINNASIINTQALSPKYSKHIEFPIKSPQEQKLSSVSKIDASSSMENLNSRKSIETNFLSVDNRPSFPALLPEVPAYLSARPMYLPTKYKSNQNLSHLKVVDQCKSVETEIENIKQQIEETLAHFATFTKDSNAKHKELLLEKHLSNLKISSLKIPKVEKKEIVKKIEPCENNVFYHKCYYGTSFSSAELSTFNLNHSTLQQTLSVLTASHSSANNNDQKEYGPDLIIQKYKIPIYDNDLATLHPRTWLNDEIINYYVNMITELSNELSKEISLDRKGYPRVYCFNSFFYSKLHSAGFSGVQRWTKKVDLFSDYDLILIPINTSNTHWSLAVIDIFKASIYYLDSMGGVSKAKATFSILKKYLIDEWKAKNHKPTIDFNNWNEIVPIVPQQTNSYDCGMFALHFALAVSLNYNQFLKNDGHLDNVFSTIQQTDMSRLRTLARKQICQGFLLDFY